MKKQFTAIFVAIMMVLGMSVVALGNSYDEDPVLLCIYVADYEIAPRGAGGGRPPCTC